MAELGSPFTPSHVLIPPPEALRYGSSGAYSAHPTPATGEVRVGEMRRNDRMEKERCPVRKEIINHQKTENMGDMGGVVYLPSISERGAAHGAKVRNKTANRSSEWQDTLTRNTQCTPYLVVEGVPAGPWLALLPARSPEIRGRFECGPRSRGLPSGSPMSSSHLRAPCRILCKRMLQ